MSSKNEKKPSKSANVPDDHPLIRAGFLPEWKMREAWDYTDRSWKDWLHDQSVPHRWIADERWFYIGALADWFVRFQPGKDSSDQSPNSSIEA